MREFIAPLKTKVQIKDYITAGEMKNYQKLMFANIKLQEKDGDLKSDNLSATDMLIAQEEMMKMAVISVNDKTANVMDELNALPASEYTAILGEVGKLFQF